MQTNEGCLTMEGRGQQLLPGIYDEITLNIISLKLSWRDMYSLAAVSRVWNDAIRSRKVYDARVNCNCTESLVLINWTPPIVGKVVSAIGLYSMRDSSFCKLPPVPNRAGFPHLCQSVALDGKVYVLGGGYRRRPRLQYHCSAEVYVLDLAGQRQWKRCAYMNEDKYSYGVSGFGCGGMDGKIYAFADSPGSEVYDPVVNSWSKIKDLLTAPEEFRVESVGNELVCVPEIPSVKPEEILLADRELYDFSTASSTEEELDDSTSEEGDDSTEGELGENIADEEVVEDDMADDEVADNDMAKEYLDDSTEEEVPEEEVPEEELDDSTEEEGEESTGEEEDESTEEEEDEFTEEEEEDNFAETGNFLDFYNPAKGEWRQVQPRWRPDSIYFMAHGKLHALGRKKPFRIYVHNTDEKSWRYFHICSFAKIGPSKSSSLAFTVKPLLVLEVDGELLAIVHWYSAQYSVRNRYCLARSTGFGSNTKKIVWHRVLSISGRQSFYPEHEMVSRLHRIRL